MFAFLVFLIFPTPLADVIACVGSIVGFLDIAGFAFDIGIGVAELERGEDMLDALPAIIAFVFAGLLDVAGIMSCPTRTSLSNSEGLILYKIASLPEPKIMLIKPSRQLMLISLDERVGLLFKPSRPLIMLMLLNKRVGLLFTRLMVAVVGRVWAVLDVNNAASKLAIIAAFVASCSSFERGGFVGLKNENAAGFLRKRV